MSKNNVIELSGRDQFTDALTDLLRTGARQLIQQAVEAELAEFMTQYTDRFLDNGRAVVVLTAINRNARSRPALGRLRSSYRKYGPKMGKR
jgi:putative transposase